MSEIKEFSDLNGYVLEDATARAEIEALKNAGVGAKLYKHVLKIGGTVIGGEYMILEATFYSHNATPLTVPSANTSLSESRSDFRHTMAIYHEELSSDRTVFLLDDLYCMGDPEGNKEFLEIWDWYTTIDIFFKLDSNFNMTDNVLEI